MPVYTAAVGVEVQPENIKTKKTSTGITKKEEDSPNDLTAGKKLTHHKEFNPSKDLPENFFMLFYGMRRCGKSTTLAYMLYTMRRRLKNYKVYLFSGTAELDPEQYSYFPPKHIFHDLALLDDELGNIIEEQTAILDVPKGKKKQALEKNRFLVVFDDVVNENTIRKSKNLNFMAVSGRHIGASVIILSQLLAGSGSVPPIVRTQADAVMMCTLPRSQRERDLISEFYLTSEDSTTAKDKGKALMDMITSVQYRNMVIGMWDTSARKTRDFVFTYGPVPLCKTPEDFKLGSPEGFEEEEESSDGGDNMSVTADSGDDTEATPTNGASDIHGGTGLRSKGIFATEHDTMNFARHGVKKNGKVRQNNTSYLPPAFSSGKSIKAFRSFSSLGMSGSRSTSEIKEHVVKHHDSFDTKIPKHMRLQGQRFQKPDKPSKKSKTFTKHKKRTKVPYGSVMRNNSLKILGNQPRVTSSR